MFPLRTTSITHIPFTKAWVTCFMFILSCNLLRIELIQELVIVYLTINDMIGRARSSHQAVEEEFGNQSKSSTKFLL